MISKIRKELWFGFSLMALIIAGTAVMLVSADTITRGHMGLMMLALVVVAIMLGFPTAFTLMGMGMIFTWLAYDRDTGKTLTLMVQSAFKVMGNDVLISIPLFVFMGYLVERANLIDKLFRSLHLALARVPGSLAVATLFTCAVFATATGIVGAVVTLMGLLALPQMLKGGYDIKVSAGAITAGGCLGILIPPSVMLIVYGATAGVSVVQLYAGAFFPGLMLAGLYVLYVVILAKIKPALMPPLSAEQRFVPLPPVLDRISQGVSKLALPGLLRGGSVAAGQGAYLRKQLAVTLLPLAVFLLFALVSWHLNTRPSEQAVSEMPVAAANGGVAEPAGAAGGVQEPPGASGGVSEPPGASTLREPAGASGGLSEPPGASSGVSEPPGADAGVKEPPGAGGGVMEPPGADGGVKEPAGATASVQEPPAASGASGATPAKLERTPATRGFWIGLGVGAVALAAFYGLLTFQRLEIFKMLLSSFFPLVVLILAVLGSIVMGLATPTEAAAVGAFGGYLLAAIYAVIAKRKEGRGRVFGLWLLLWAPALAAIGWFILHDEGLVAARVPSLLGTAGAIGVAAWLLVAYRQSGLQSEVKESVLLTAKTSAMVCWLFVGSAIFSAAFALLGGQELVEKWVMSMNLTKTQFLILSQVIIFILGWPLEWTEIIVIFMPIFIPLLDNFGVDPLFFGLLVALNLQTAFLSPPVAMAAFYLKGVSPPHVTLNQIFAGMLPFMGIQVLAIFMLYIFPEIGMWLPQVLYGR
ncbi:TRAP transporter large permease subunit [Ramlibacter sp. MAHUQ-53]|uniref:TRAP transporter large permease subunit n=1 Tax=unclassified Ramlibacter TaxID=2617605 RepID=UPI00362F63C9